MSTCRPVALGLTCLLLACSSPRKAPPRALNVPAFPAVALAPPTPEIRLPCPITVHDIPVTMRGGVPIPCWGVTTYGDKGLREIVFCRFLANDETLCRLVCAHELGHVLGLEHMGTGWMRPHIMPKDPLIHQPTDEEKTAVMLSPQGKRWRLTLDKTVTTPIAEAIAWAASAWNEAMGQPLFVVDFP